ncbi:MAG: M1 family aminopeptidase [Bryobacteraceae bacterium]
MRGTSRWMILLAVSAAALMAQPPAPNLEIQKYAITANINPRTQQISATAQIDFTPNDTISQATFELNNALAVTKVTDGSGQSLADSRNVKNFTITVSFPQPLVKNQPSQVAVTYQGKLTGDQDSPVNGIRFAALHPGYGYLLYPARWFPVSGYTTNRFLADLQITVPAGYSVVASGDEKTAPAKGGGTTYSFHYDHPSFPGSIAIVQGDPVQVSSEGIASQIYFRGAQAAEAQSYGEATGKMMTFFTSQYGLAPQAHMTLVETDNGAVNGYAAPGIIFLAPSEITNPVKAPVLADQISRQWWGVLVSPTNRDHLWLMNGPARYSELIYTKFASGKSAMENAVKETYIEALTVKNPPIIQASRLQDYSPEYWALTAAKGAAVLNMLKSVIGEKAFDQGLKEFLNKYSWQSADTQDFRLVMEQASGQQLKAFFIQWLESTGAPDFKLQYTIYRTQKGFRVVGKINQDLDTFRMPVLLRIETEGNPQDQTVEVTGTSSEFSVNTFGLPKKVIIDPNHVLLREDPQTEVEVEIRRGEQFVAVNDFSNALKAYQKALEVNRNSSLAHFRVGELFFKQNNFQAAADAFRRAINGDLQPKWTEVWSYIDLGKVFDVTDQRQRAVNQYKQAIRTHDNTANAQKVAAAFLQKPYRQKNSEI